MKRHSLDPLAFVFGVLFSLIGVMFLAGHVDITTVGRQWAWPALLAGAGLLLMVMTARPSASRRRAAPVAIPASDVDEPSDVPSPRQPDAGGSEGTDAGRTEEQ